jgi:DNA-binding protein H-NS
MNLKSMSLDRLVGLRDRVDAALNSKVIDQRRTLESELSKLTGFQGGAGRSKSFGPSAKGKVAAKYRNPDDHSETWAGRGLKPRWLTAAIKAGKRPDDFLIAGAAKSAKANGRKKAPKARK